MAGGGGGGGDFDVNINLTALLDVLTNLLFFLMVGFAAQQASMEVDGGVRLPVSSADNPPKKALTVSVGQRDIRVEKEVVLPIKNGQIVGAEPKGKIEVLYRKLLAAKEQKVASTLESPEILFVLADKDTPYAVLRRVMMTGAEAGFPKFRMAVMME